MHRLLFLEFQSKLALRTFATDTSLLRTLLRSTDTCSFPNQQIRIERQSCSVTRLLHYQLRAVIDLSFLKVKKPLVDRCVDVSSQRYSTPDRIICRRKLDCFAIK